MNPSSRALSARTGAHRDESGAIAVMVALGAVLMLLLAAFAVDIGNALAQGRQLSVSADAAALAAARKVGEVYASPTCTATGLAAVGADALATTTATAVNAENNKDGRSATTDTVTAQAYCSQDGTAILVDVRTSREVPTDLAGLVGIGSTHPYAEATGQWQRSLVGSIRPWAACLGTVQQAQANPDVTQAAPMDNKWGVCGTSSSGNWGSVDFDGGGNSATDLANWTRFGYPLMPTIPGQLPADPGVSTSQLGAAFTALLNTPILLPVAANYLDGASGNNGEFVTSKLALVRFCGAYFQNKEYKPSTAPTCWAPVYPEAPTYAYQDVLATGGAMTKGAADLTVTAPVPFFQSTWANNPDITITVAGAGPGGRDLSSSITGFTNGQEVTLKDKVTANVTAAKVTVTIRTLVPPTTTPPAPLQSNGVPYNQIQFRFLRLYENSAQASVPCTLDDTLCPGVTTLFR